MTKDWLAVDSPKKRTDEFDLFAVNSNKANKINSSVRFFWEKLADHKLLLKLTGLYKNMQKNSTLLFSPAPLFGTLEYVSTINPTFILRKKYKITALVRQKLVKFDNV